MKLSAPLRVLIACEFTGTVRRAFERLGHDAWSCDLRTAEDGSNRHVVGDAREVVLWGWDLLILAHPPCTRLCNSGVRWLSVPPPGRTRDELWRELDEGADLFSAMWNAPVDRVAVENPVMHRHAKARIANYRESAQSVQPWQFGDWETKRTCLWLRGLDPLVPTYRTMDDARRELDLPADAKPSARVHRMPPGEARERERSRFFPGIAAAMAEQWGGAAQQDERAAT